MIVLAIDPGSVTAGYALLRKEGSKIQYISSGILKFCKENQFLDRVRDIHDQTHELLAKHKPDEIALESLIFVKSPTALIKLAQSRGVMLGVFSQNYHQKIFEYSPNLVKSTVTGHGHADKEGIQKVITQYLGVTDFKSHDESDAIAIALCHLLNQNQINGVSSFRSASRKKSGKGLASALAHKIKENNL